MLRISVWSYYLAGLSPEEMVQTFSAHGWHYAELSSEHGWDLLKRGDPNKVGRAFKAYADDHGFSFPQAHFDLGADIAQPEASQERQETLDNLKRWCDLFAAIGVEAGVLHPGGERLWGLGWERSDTLACSAGVLQVLLTYVQDTPTTLCLENSWHPEDTMHLVDTLASPGLGVCMDTGHLNLTGGSWQEFLEWAGPRLRALHIADNRGERDDHILPYGLGTIQWQGFGEALLAAGYSGLFNFEIGGETRGCPLPVRLAKLDYIRQLARIMLGESP